MPRAFGPAETCELEGSGQSQAGNNNQHVARATARRLYTDQLASVLDDKPLMRMTCREQRRFGFKSGKAVRRGGSESKDRHNFGWKSNHFNAISDN